MSIYTGPVFEMAREQFQTVADYLDIPASERDRLLASFLADEPIEDAGQAQPREGERER